MRTGALRMQQPATQAHLVCTLLVHFDANLGVALTHGRVGIHANAMPINATPAWHPAGPMLPTHTGSLQGAPTPAWRPAGPRVTASTHLLCAGRLYISCLTGTPQAVSASAMAAASCHGTITSPAGKGGSGSGCPESRQWSPRKREHTGGGRGRTDKARGSEGQQGPSSRMARQAAMAREQGGSEAGPALA